MSGDEGFLQAIIDDPDDDTVRLIYADWLDDHGNHARAEFIRVQIDLAQMKEDDDRRYDLETRQAQLLAEHEAEWLKPFAPIWEEARFRRGFLDNVEVIAALVLDEVELKLRTIPIRTANLLSGSGREEELARSSFFARLQGLDLNGADIDTATLLASPHLARLQRLSLSYDPCSGPLQEVFTSPAHLPNLRELFFYGCSLGPRVMAAVASTARRETLRKLEILHSELTTVSLEVLADAGPWAKLQMLRLEAIEIDQAGMRALCQILQGKTLTSLELSLTRVGNAGVEMLSRTPGAASLRWLSLEHNRLAASGARALSTSPHLTQLELLNCSSNQIGEEGARAIAGSSNFTRLEVLDLRGNEIGDGGAEALAASDRLGSLTRLQLSANGLRVTGVKDLVKTGKLANLRQLDLSSNLLGDMGLQVLARSPHLGRLRTLNLCSNKIGTTGIKDLAAFRNLTGLRELYLGGNEIDDEAARILLDSPLCKQLTVLDLHDTDITPAILPAVERLAASTPLRDVRLLSHELREEHLAPVKALLMHR